MPTQDTTGIKEKILLIIKRRGPSLPVHVARETGLSMLFASAFLSELNSEQKIKISNMKVGGSPVYFIPGQEPLLENFSQFLKSKEKDSFLLLKEKKILRDREQDPAIRVALRAIKDFAIPFRKNEEIFWKYFTIQEREIEEKIKERKPEKVISKSIIRVGKFNDKIDRPLITIKSKQIKKPKEKSEFILRVLEFLKAKDIELIEETNFKKKEFYGIARINSDLGKIEFLIIGKDKKKVTENDLILAVQKSHSEKRIVLFISTGELDKKAANYFNRYKNIIKFLKI